MKQRQAIEHAIEALIAVLDLMDGDPDRELDADFEPSLGWTIQGGVGQIHDDREFCEVAA